MSIARSAKSGWLIGDLGVWPKSAHVEVQAGQEIGKVANLAQEGYPAHLHLGLSVKPLVGADGTLLPDFRAGNWARLLYREDQPGAREAAAEKAAGLGFIDPMEVLRP